MLAPGSLPGHRKGDRLFAALGKNTLNCLDHFIVIERFGNVINRAQLHGIHRRTEAGIAGHNQYRRAPGQFDQVGAVSTGQAKVTDDHVVAGKIQRTSGID